MIQSEISGTKCIAFPKSFDCERMILYPNDDVGYFYTEISIDERALGRCTACHMISFYVFFCDQFIMWQISTEKQHHDKGSGFVSAIPEVLQSNAKHD